MAEKSYEIIKNVDRPKPQDAEQAWQAEQKGVVGDTLHTGKRSLKFGTHGGMTIHDAGEAREIQQTVGQDGTGDVVVVEVDRSTTARGAREMEGHRYFFGQMPEMPWHRAERLKREAEERDLRDGASGDGGERDAAGADQRAGHGDQRVEAGAG